MLLSMRTLRLSAELTSSNHQKQGGKVKPQEGELSFFLSFRVY